MKALLLMSEKSAKISDFVCEHDEKIAQILDMVKKIINLRIMDDENGVMNKSILDVGGDILSISEKIISLCQNRVVYKKDMKISMLAKFLSKFAMKTDAGVGVSEPYKMQFAIDICGPLKVLYAAVLGGIGKLFGKRGIFYDIVGIEVSG